MLIPVKDNKKLLRDEYSGAIVSTEDGFAEYLQRKNISINNTKRIDKIEEVLEKLVDQNQKITTILEKLINANT